jgi:signal transduction histidine kinase
LPGLAAGTLHRPRDRAELAVTDTGVGIPKTELPRLFERFHRVKGAKSRTHEGTGIGLALVQELVSLHGGVVRIESEEGQGSTFTVTVKTGIAQLLARVRTDLELARVRREWANELEQANSELEAFSYSVSHDLRAPLRTIDGYSTLLLEEHAAVLDPQASRYIKRIRNGIQKMSGLSDDLLNLSRIAACPSGRRGSILRNSRTAWSPISRIEILPAKLPSISLTNFAPPGTPPS